MNRFYGWKNEDPSPTEEKLIDYLKNSSIVTPKEFVIEINSGVYDQGAIGACTSSAALTAYELNKKKSLSRLFVYYHQRKLNGTLNHDMGASVLSAMKVLKNRGACEEKYHAYNHKNLKKKPSIWAYANSYKYRISKYLSVEPNIEQFKTALIKCGPIVFGIYVKKSFENIDETGMLIDSPEEPLTGGHAVMCYGFTETHFICLNSWGEGWGKHGSFYMPYDYLKNCGDAWVIIYE
jgi:C1A family cysteine protease